METTDRHLWKETWFIKLYEGVPDVNRKPCLKALRHVPPSTCPPIPQHRRKPRSQSSRQKSESITCNEHCTADVNHDLERYLSFIQLPGHYQDNTHSTDLLQDSKRVQNNFPIIPFFNMSIQHLFKHSRNRIYSMEFTTSSKNEAGVKLSGNG